MGPKGARAANRNEGAGGRRTTLQCSAWGGTGRDCGKEEDTRVRGERGEVVTCGSRQPRDSSAVAMAPTAPELGRGAVSLLRTRAAPCRAQCRRPRRRRRGGRGSRPRTGRPAWARGQRVGRQGGAQCICVDGSGSRLDSGLDGRLDWQQMHAWKPAVNAIALNRRTFSSRYLPRIEPPSTATPVATPCPSTAPPMTPVCWGVACGRGQA